MKCPSCEGKREVFAFINTGPDWRKHRHGMVPCLTCEGEGQISGEHAQRIAAGKEMRCARIARGETLMTAAKRMGLTPAEVSAIEMGRMEGKP